MNKQNTALSVFINLVVPCILKSLKMWETRSVCVCVCVCVWFSIHTHNFSSVSWAGLEATTSQYQWAYPAPRSWFPIPFSDKRNQDSLEKWMVLELGQEIYKQAWDQKVGKCSHIHEAHTVVRAYPRARMATGESPNSRSWDNLSN